MLGNARTVRHLTTVFLVKEEGILSRCTLIVLGSVNTPNERHRAKTVEEAGIPYQFLL
jgi:hypothetical protein